MRVEPHVPAERHVVLNWVGPFMYDLARELTVIPYKTSKSGCRDTYDGLPAGDIWEKPGVYLMVGDHPLHGIRSLLYIGQTDCFCRRFKQHDVWLSQEWRVEVYLAEVNDVELHYDIEKLFIYAHGPHYNSVSAANPPKVIPPLRVWNEGCYWKLYPEVSSRHNWFCTL